MGTKRKSEMWISNNRVLVGGNKKLHGRNPNFETEETKLLISLWGDPKVQKTLITTHKKHPVIVMLAEKMREFGYHRSPEEINTRIKNLKCFYNRIKKDMDMGVTTDPTWKHYTAMDEIMTRPIFSVRPDEIPKPSLRFKMEEEASADAEASEKSAGDGESGVSDEDEEELFSQEMLAAEATGDDEDNSPKAKEKEDDPDEDEDVEITPVIEPKQEPIDIDDDDMEELMKDRTVEEADDIFPKLSAYLQIASNTSTMAVTSQSSKIVTTIAASQSKDANTKISNAIKLSQPIMFANQQQTVAGQQGKISLVPTNFLLKPPQQQLQLRPPAQQIFYTKPNMSGAQCITTSGAGQMPMKVLLVNALQKNPGTAQTTTVTDSSNKTPSTTTIQNNGFIKTNGTDSAHKSGHSIKVPKSGASSSGFRALISQLVQVQNDNLEVSRQRLEVEKQRLEFEKSIAEKFLNAFPIFQSMSNGSTSLPLLIPKVEKED